MKLSRFFQLMFLTLVLMAVMTFSACSQKQTSETVASGDQPCWVTGDPACDDQANDHLYFIGQNAVPEANRARPSRAAYDSARMNAKTQYVAFIEETVANKASEAITAAGDTEEGSQAVTTIKSLSKTFAKKTVSGLKQFDSYYVSESMNSKEIPLWTVYVRMRVQKAEVQQKFGTLTDNIKKSADGGNQSAKRILDGIQKVNNDMKKDDFFKGL